MNGPVKAKKTTEHVAIIHHVPKIVEESIGDIGHLVSRRSRT